MNDGIEAAAGQSGNSKHQENHCNTKGYDCRRFDALIAEKNPYTGTATPGRVQ